MALQDRTGQKVPSVVFRTRVGDTWKDVSTDDLFKGKKVVVFSLPGAFTPTCSSSHLPRYNELFGAFKENGVDAIYCVSVNDTFVMNAWAAEEEADNIYMIPDGNGEFTEGMGMLVGKEDLGFGKRSWRYSMLVNDGVVVAIFTKPGCQFCAKAKKALQDKGLSYEEIVLGKDATVTSVRAITGKMTAPQVFIGGKYIGGSEDLEAYLAKN